MSPPISLIAPLPASWKRALRRRYRGWRDTLKLWRAGMRDVRVYARHSGLRADHRKGVLQAQILKSYHRIEKGLALKAPRPGFGADAIALLIDDLRDYRARYGHDHAVERGLQTLEEYRAFNADAGRAVPEVSEFLQGYADRERVLPSEGGTIEVTRAAIHAAATLPIDAFFQSRYSVRQFSAEPVADDLIAHAVQLAQKSPSVCNRQAGRVYVATGKTRIAELLAYQNGNRGFGDQADKLLVVTASLDCFLTVGERYQCWIDGGLFAMSLIYALHALGLGSCCLNWSVEPGADRTFKAAAGIPDDQAIIMLLAVGHLPERLRVATSARRPLDEVLRQL